MGKKFYRDWQFLLGLMLVLLSSTVYFIHYLIFRDAHHIFIYLIGDIAFVFIEVLIVTLVLHRILNLRERQELIKKLNMVVGTFFSEVGSDLLRKFFAFDSAAMQIKKDCIINNTWDKRNYQNMTRSIRDHTYDIKIDYPDLEALKFFLNSKRDFMLSLLNNPKINDHESFTECLWAVFHLLEELGHRAKLNDLPDSDYAHIAVDIQRAYSKLALQWIHYMKYLRRDYPHLFSLALRTNPFNDQAEVVVQV